MLTIVYDEEQPVAAKDLDHACDRIIQSEGDAKSGGYGRYHKSRITQRRQIYECDAFTGASISSFPLARLNNLRELSTVPESSSAISSWE